MPVSPQSSWTQTQELRRLKVRQHSQPCLIPGIGYAQRGPVAFKGTEQARAAAESPGRYPLGSTLLYSFSVSSGEKEVPCLTHNLSCQPLCDIGVWGGKGYVYTQGLALPRASPVTRLQWAHQAIEFHFGRFSSGRQLEAGQQAFSTTMEIPNNGTLTSSQGPSSTHVVMKNTSLVAWQGTEQLRSNS